MSATANDEREVAEERFRVLGDLLARGWATEGDIAAVRLVQAACLRAHSSMKHYPLFGAVRQGGLPGTPVRAAQGV